MGRRLVAATFLLYGNRLAKNHAAFRVLLFMANTAKDDADPPTFWMGEKALSELAMGRPDGTDADLRAVRRALSDLRKAGAIETIGRPAPGRRMATYRLHIDASPSIERRTVNVLRSGVDPVLTQDGERPITQDGERPMHVGRSPSYKAQEVDIGLGKTPGQTAAPAPRTDARNGPPNDVAETFARNGLKAGRLRSIQGGRPDDAPDAGPVQLPLLAAVPAPEPATHQRVTKKVTDHAS